MTDSHSWAIWCIHILYPLSIVFTTYSGATWHPSITNSIHNSFWGDLAHSHTPPITDSRQIIFSISLTPSIADSLHSTFWVNLAHSYTQSLLNFFPSHSGSIWHIHILNPLQNLFTAHSGATWHIHILHPLEIQSTFCGNFAHSHTPSNTASLHSTF